MEFGMTRLRQKFIEDLEVRNYSPSTIRAYVRHVAVFAKYFSQSPDRLGREQIHHYQLYLVRECKLATPTVSQIVAGLRFFYETTLGRKWISEHIPYPRHERRLPCVLARHRKRGGSISVLGRRRQRGSCREMPENLVPFVEWAKDPDHLLALAAFLVSAAAFLVSGFVAVSSRRFQRRQIALQETQASLEETARNQAALTVEKKKTDRPGQGLLVVKNSGSAAARNVRLKLDGVTPHEHASVLDDVPDVIPVIGAGADVVYKTATSGTRPAATSARIEWDDEAGWYMGFPRFDPHHTPRFLIDPSGTANSFSISSGVGFSMCFSICSRRRSLVHVQKLANEPKRKEAVGAASQAWTLLVRLKSISASRRHRSRRPAAKRRQAFPSMS